MEARRFVEFAEELVLSQEPSEFGLVVPGLGVVEVGLGIEEIPRESEAVLALVEFLWESEVAPRVLGNQTDPIAEKQTSPLRGRQCAGGSGGAPFLL